MAKKVKWVEKTAGQENNEEGADDELELEDDGNPENG